MGKAQSNSGNGKLGKSCFIIAEAGSNHNGSLEQAKRMVDVAKEAGADAVKFQIFRASTMYPKKNIGVKYLKSIGIKEDLYSIIKKFEVPYDWIEILARYCQAADIEFMATPFDLQSVKLLNDHVNYFKIASYESLYLDLIEEVKKTGKPLLISTGGCYENEIDLLFDKSLNDYKDKTVLFHCVAKYPAPLSDINLSVIPYMANKYNVRMGYSDHTEDPVIAPVVAVSLGACSVEKHFTLSKNLPGPDHSFAIEPHELKAMVKAIRSAEKTVSGRKKRQLFKCEEELYFYKRCFYAKKDLPKGYVIKEKDLMVLRNAGDKGEYFNPMEKELLVGASLKKPKKAQSVIKREDVQ